MELLLTLVLALTAVPSPSGIELERLADNSFDPPGIDGEFSIEFPPPVVCGERVLFNRNTFADIRSGLYSASSAGVEVIANAGTPVPGSSTTCQGAGEPACSGRGIVFIGDDDLTPSSSGPSVYVFNQGVITPQLEAGTPIGANMFTGFGDLDANEGVVALDARLFPTSTNQAIVIKPFDGDPVIVADRTTVMPGQTEPVTIYSQPVLAGSDLLFHARTNLSLGCESRLRSRLCRRILGQFRHFRRIEWPDRALDRARTDHGGRPDHHVRRLSQRRRLAPHLQGHHGRESGLRHLRQAAGRATATHSGARGHHRRPDGRLHQCSARPWQRGDSDQ